MAAPKKNSPKPASLLLRIHGKDDQIAQAMNYADAADPSIKPVLLLNMRDGRLGDLNDQTIFEGQIILRIADEVTAAAAMMIGEILKPIKGTFQFIVTGTYTKEAAYAEVLADRLVYVEMQRTLSKTKKKLKLVSVL